MKLSRNRPLVLFLLGLAILAGIGSLHFLHSGPGARERLVILTPHGDNIRQEIGSAFQAWHAGRFGSAPEVEWVDQGGTSEGLRYVQARFARSPGSIGVDVFFGGGTPPFRTLAKSGLLIPEPIPLPAGLPSDLDGIRLHAPEEGWYGIALSSFGILTNRTLLRDHRLPEPVSWADLARPEAFGWVACVDPRGSGSAHVIYEIVLQKFGWEKGFSLLTRMAANARTFTKGASGVLPLISTGEAAYTVAIDQYAWSLIAGAGASGRDRIGFVLPEGETVITPDPAALLKGAPNPATARRFLDFLVSLEGQRLWVLNPGSPGGPRSLSLSRLSVRPEAYDGLDSANRSVGYNPFDTEAPAAGAPPFTYSDSLTESRWALVSDLLGLWMVDSHEAAAAAWEPLVGELRRSKRVDPEAWEAEVSAHPRFRAPMSWEALRPMAERWKDQEFRNSAMAGWSRELAAGSRREAGGSLHDASGRGRAGEGR